MPTYSYKCLDCGHAFDIHQSFNDDALTTCPECGGMLRKVFGAVGVTFKGSGFYRTDSRSGPSASVPSKKEPSTAPAAKSEGASASSSSTSSSSSSTTTSTSTSTSTSSTGSSS